MPIVKVRWVDAYSPDSPWVAIDSLPDVIPEQAWVTSVGHLLKDTPDGIWISQGTGMDGMACQVMFIPKVFLQIVETIENV